MSSGRLITMLAPPSPQDAILRLIRVRWPNAQFQDANDSEVRPLSDPWVWRFGVQCKEFFVYRDAQSVQDWEDGPTRTNRNGMIHVGVEDRSASFAFDALSDEMRPLLRDLRQTLENQAMD